MAAAWTWLGVGAVSGAAVSALPLEFALLVLPVLLFVLAGMAGRAWRGRTMAPLRPWLVGPFRALGVMAAASFAPLKWVDRTRVAGLEDRCVTVGRVLQQLQARDVADAGDQQRQVCFERPQPSVREALQVLEVQAGLRLEYGWCGTGTGLLFGLHPIGGPRLATGP